MILVSATFITEHAYSKNGVSYTPVVDRCEEVIWRFGHALMSLAFICGEVAVEEMSKQE